MADNESLMRRKEAATPRGVAVMASFFVERALNSEVWDVEGHRYIDFTGGIAVLNTGHCHPKVVAAVAEQLQRFTHACYQVAPYESYVTLAERLNQLTPGGHAKKTAFFNSGAEAVENAVKIARAATGRAGLIAFSGAFHGRTMMGLALTGKVAPYKTGFGPMPGEVHHVPFPSALHGISTEDTLASLQRLFKADVDPKGVAAILIEVVQGEGGFYVAPRDLLTGLRAICDEHGVLLIADEVQTGFGRTGRLFAMEHFGVVPDLMAMAKSMAGGFVLSAVTGRAEIMDAPAPGGLGGTYAGNPLSITAALAVLDVIEEEGLVERAEVIGQRVRERLSARRATVPQIAEVRGLGAMMAVEFLHPVTRQPEVDFTKKVQRVALEKGLMLLTCGVYANVIRFLMPLTIDDATLEEGLKIVEEALCA